jgi:hypothetical protein
VGTSDNQGCTHLNTLPPSPLQRDSGQIDPWHALFRLSRAHGRWESFTPWSRSWLDVHAAHAEICKVEQTQVNVPLVVLGQWLQAPLLLYGFPYAIHGESGQRGGSKQGLVVSHTEGPPSEACTLWGASMDGGLCCVDVWEPMQKGSQCQRRRSSGATLIPRQSGGSERTRQRGQAPAHGEGGGNKNFIY